jgi:ASC-1-like (ASCH) protein
MQVAVLFFALIMVLAASSFGTASDKQAGFKTMAKEEGVQILYIDEKSIVRSKDIAQGTMINQFIKGGKLYTAFRTKYPSSEPSFTTWTVMFDCSKLRAKVSDMKLYDAKNKLIDRLPLDDRWNQLQIKNETDKNLYNTLCK